MNNARDIATSTIVVASSRGTAKRSAEIGHQVLPRQNKTRQFKMNEMQKDDSYAQSRSIAREYLVAFAAFRRVDVESIYKFDRRDAKRRDT